MEVDIEFLETPAVVCGDIVFRSHPLWSDCCAAVYRIRDFGSRSVFRELFGEFVKLFPYHPTADNTYVVVAADSVGIVVLFWICRHFEHTALNDLALLIHFMTLVRNWTLAEPDGVHVLDDVEELVILRFWCRQLGGLPKKVRKTIRELLARIRQSRQTPGKQ